MRKQHNIFTINITPYSYTNITIQLHRNTTIHLQTNTKIHLNNTLNIIIHSLTMSAGITTSLILIFETYQHEISLPCLSEFKNNVWSLTVHVSKHHYFGIVNFAIVN